ncbi:CsxC family protein [Clostridium ganghwense]|uniref:DUF7852 domain-containing protein n=1 Tax=Clostridium ganghwense TaxID=312089 RepID=A0ABT4CUU3_9CLOT|nr:hypothetical protein [Clostridium ganghwense]MCY6371996.1 hypothetical protein [Clostridium ganghwense]
MTQYNQYFYNKADTLIKILILLEFFQEYYNEDQEHITNNKENIENKEYKRNKNTDGKRVKNNNLNYKEFKEYYDSGIGKLEKGKNQGYEASKEKEVRQDSGYVSKIPVVIAEKSVKIPVEVLIELKEEALEIKRTNHQAYLNEAILVPIEDINKDIKTKKGKLFLKGFVRNNVEYSTVDNIEDNIISGEIKHKLAYIPFECTTLIEYSLPPNFHIKDDVKEIILNISNNLECNEHMYESEQEIKYNQPICCDIKKVKISGTRMCNNKKPLSDKFPIENTFSAIEEKMIVELFLTLTQRQSVEINN